MKHQEPNTCILVYHKTKQQHKWLAKFCVLTHNRISYWNGFIGPQLVHDNLGHRQKSRYNTLFPKEDSKLADDAAFQVGSRQAIDTERKQMTHTISCERIRTLKDLQLR